MSVRALIGILLCLLVQASAFATSIEQFESGMPAGWTVSGSTNPGWGPSTTRAFSGTTSLYCAVPDSAYPNDHSTRVTFQADLSSLTFAQLRCWYWLDAEVDYDFFSIGVSTDGVTYDWVDYTGELQQWTETVLNLATDFPRSYLDEPVVYIVFQFESDESFTHTGVFIDDVVLQTSADTGSISGALIDSVGRPLQGVKMTLTPGNRTTTTNAAGEYVFADLIGTYTVTPSRAGLTFDPASTTFPSLTSAEVASFQATTAAGRIVGIIRNGAGVAQPGVRVECQPLGETAITNAYGRYVFPSLHGTYTVTPAIFASSFTPGSRTLVVDDGEVRGHFTLVDRDPGRVDYFAVCVGVTANLSYPDDDARDLRDALIARGWLPTNIITLVDNEPTKTAIHDAIDQVLAAADSNDVVLYFQSSHGGQTIDAPPLDEADNKDEYLATVTDGITDDELTEWLSGSPTTKLITMFDFCYSGGMFKGLNFADEFAGEVARGLKMNTKDMDDLAGGVSIASSDYDELSYEDDALGNGVFIYYIVDGLMNQRADLNRNGAVSAEEAFAWAAPRIVAFEPTQHAQIYDGHPGELEFAFYPTLLETTSPARGATRVDRNANLRLTWRYRMNEEVTQSKVKLYTQDNKLVPGTIRWITPNKVLVFNPTPTLAANALYKVRILTQTKLAGGGLIWRTDGFNFRTAATAAAPALALTASALPADNGTSQLTISLSAAATVSATICNMAGRPVAALQPRDLPFGLSTLSWNGRAVSGLMTPSGQYLVRVEALDEDGNRASCLTSLRR